MTTNPATVEVYAALGSNTDARAHIDKGLALLREYPQVQVIAVSGIYQSPDHSAHNGADYLNTVVKLHTELSPLALKTDVFAAIESACGRNRQDKRAVTLDLDLLLWGGEVFSYGQKPWHIPHAGTLTHADVIVPLAEIAPQLCHPITGENFAQIAANLPPSARAGVRRID